MSEVTPAVDLVSSEWAAWVQAVGSVLAICVAAWLVIWQSRRQHINALKLHKEEQRYARVELAKTLSVLGQNCAKALRHFTDRLPDREAVHSAAGGEVHFDFGELRTIENAVVGIPLHSLPDVLVTHAMVLGATVRQFRERIEMAITLHREMTSDNFDDFFRVLNEMNTSIAKTCNDIESEVHSIVGDGEQ